MDAEGQNCFLRRYKLIIFEEKEELNRTQRMWFRVKKRVLTARLLSVQNCARQPGLCTESQGMVMNFEFDLSTNKLSSSFISALVGETFNG